MVATRRSARLSQGGSETMSPPPPVPKRASRAKKEVKETDVKPKTRARRTTRSSLSKDDVDALMTQTEITAKEEEETAQVEAEKIDVAKDIKDEVVEKQQNLSDNVDGKETMQETIDQHEQSSFVETIDEKIEVDEEIVAESTSENDAKAVDASLKDSVQDNESVEYEIPAAEKEDGNVQTINMSPIDELDENVNMESTLGEAPANMEDVNEENNAPSSAVESEEHGDEVSASENENQDGGVVVIPQSSDNENDEEIVEMAQASENEEEEHVALAPASDDGNEEEDHVAMASASDNEEDHVAMAPDSDMDEANEPSANDQDANDDDDDDLEQLVGLAVSSFKSTNEPTSANSSSVAPSLVSNKLESGVEYSNLYLKFNGKRCSKGAELIPERKLAEEAAQFKKQIVYKKKMDETNAAAHAKKVDRDRIQTSSKWFNMVSNEMTAEAKRDIQLIKLRNYLDPKRFYKSSDHKKSNMPKVFQVGTVIEGAAEFKSNRLSRKERQQTFTEEILHDQAIRSYTKRKYNEIQTVRANDPKKPFKKMKHRK